MSGINISVGSSAARIKTTTLTDPAVNAAVTKAIVDDYGGVIITTTAASNAQTIQNPTAITTNKEFIVANNDTSTDPITVNDVVIAVGEAQKFFWDGSSWLTLEAVSASQISITDAGDLIVADEVEGALQENRTAINLNTAKVSATGLVNTATYATDQTLTVAQCKGYIIYVTGAATVTLPARFAGMNVSIITIGAVEVSIDPNASDLIVLDGIALDDGDKITNLSTAGDIAVITDYGADGFYASTNSWTDGGA